MSRIFDPSRKKYVKATPEEIVRQKFVRYLVSLGYPITNIATEQTFELAGRKIRADIVVYKEGEPVMIIECKAPEININSSTLEQIWRYNFVAGAKYLAMTNGQKVVLCKVEGGECIFLPKFLTWDEIV